MLTISRKSGHFHRLVRGAVRWANAWLHQWISHVGCYVGGFHQDTRGTALFRLLRTETLPAMETDSV